MTAARSAPLSPGLLAAEAAAAASSAALCAQSLEAYALVRAEDGTPREDAVVNRCARAAPRFAHALATSVLTRPAACSLHASGNVLAAWAELAPPGECAPLLARACAAYEAAAAAADPEAPADVELLRSWADCLVRRAELAAGAGDAAAAGALYDRAHGAYAAACGGADSTQGDDVAARPQLRLRACMNVCVCSRAHPRRPSHRDCCTTGAAACTRSRSTCRARPAPRRTWSWRRPSCAPPRSSAPATRTR